MRFVSTWLSYVGYTLVGTICLCSVAVLVGYFPFTATLGAGWDGWFAGEKIARLSLVVIAGRAIVLPLLVVGLVVATMDALLQRARRSLGGYAFGLCAVVAVATYVAVRSVPGVGLVTSDVAVAMLFASGLFAASRIRELARRRSGE